MRTTSDHITALEPNEIFVFGSNLEGVHAGGAAFLAYDKFGAVSGDKVSVCRDRAMRSLRCREE